MLNPQDVSRENLAAEVLSFIDRLTGAPVRIVANNADVPAKPKLEKPAPKKVKKAQEPQQMDIEDLFGNLR